MARPTKSPPDWIVDGGVADRMNGLPWADIAHRMSAEWGAHRLTGRERERRTIRRDHARILVTRRAKMRQIKLRKTQPAKNPENGQWIPLRETPPRFDVPHTEPQTLQRKSDCKGKDAESAEEAWRNFGSDSERPRGA